MSRIIDETKTVDTSPSSYEGNTFTSSYYQNLNNGFGTVTDTNYARFTMRNTSYEIYYVFDALDIPSGATINSVSCSVKCYVSNGSYYPSLQVYAGTTAKGSASNVTSTSTTHVQNLSVGSWTVSELNGEIRLHLKCVSVTTRNSRYAYLYGATFSVTYTYQGTAYEISVTNNTSTVTASPMSDEVMGGGSFTLNMNGDFTGVTLTDNGTDVTSQIVQGVDGTINAVADDVTTADIQSGSSYAEYAVGNSADDPYTSTSNMYASDEGYADYSFDFSSIPSNATINNMEVEVYGHRESSTIDSSHIARCILYSGSTQKGESLELQSTSNSKYTMTNCGTWTREELQSAKLRFLVGYYGGLLCGITWYVSYSVDGYTYTISNIGADHVLVLGSGSNQKVYIKVNGSWIEFSKIYKKVNGAWVEQSDFSQVFESGKVYIKA